MNILPGNIAAFSHDDCQYAGNIIRYDETYAVFSCSVCLVTVKKHYIALIIDYFNGNPGT